MPFSVRRVSPERQRKPWSAEKQTAFNKTALLLQSMERAKQQQILEVTDSGTMGEDELGEVLTMGRIIYRRPKN